MTFLPLEIVDLIIQKLPRGSKRPTDRWQNHKRHRHLGTLLSLCLVSKGVYSITKKYLYEVYYVTEHDGVNLTKFLAEILKDPQLANYLKFVHYERDLDCKCRPAQWNTHHRERECIFWPLPSVRIFSPQEVALFTQLDCLVHFSRHISRNCPEAQMLLLLCLAPNITELSIQLPRAEDQEELFVDGLRILIPKIMVGRNFIFNSVILQKLSRLSLESSAAGSTSYFELAHMLPLISLPSVTSLTTFGAWSAETWVGRLANWVIWESTITNVTSLRLCHNFELREDMLIAMVQACPRLQSLEIHTATRARMGYDLGEVRKVLRLVRATLKTLLWDYNAEDNQTHVSPFNTFCALKSISIGMNSMVANPTWPKIPTQAPRYPVAMEDWFPPSIENIRLLWDSGSMDSEEDDIKVLMAFARSCKSHCPNLRHFYVIDFYNKITFGDELEEIFLSQGVKFVDWLILLRSQCL